MKYLFKLSLMFSLFFSFAVAGTDYADKADRIWDKQYKVPNYNTVNCSANMRLFGPDNIYQCNCDKLSDCDFGNDGKCRTRNCTSGYGGAFCQKILYHKYLKKSEKEKENLFTRTGITITNSETIKFTYKYRIHFIKIKCNSQVSANITLSIDSRTFCEVECQDSIECEGDATGKKLEITTNGEISLSKLEVFGCSRFWFGKNCGKQCHCASSAECHKMTGSCSMDCESGRHGAKCQKLNYENVAFNKSASQSTTYNSSIILQNNTCQNAQFNFSANLAVDGNIDQQFQRLSCMHTQKQSNSFWTVDLGKRYNISQIRIYNRNENAHRIKGIKITVDDQLFGEINIIKNIIDIDYGGLFSGRKIEFKREGSEIMNFCEVEVWQCLDGFYGKKCDQYCHQCINSTCEKWSGRCYLGCATGYEEYNLQNCIACQVGTFGERCSLTCHCENNKRCDHKSGTCGPEGCEAGFSGHNCQESCQVGTFGKGCSQTCHCENNEKCDHKNGTCGLEGCEAGFSGHNCQESCQVGTFGKGCSQTCHCENNEKCDHKNGTCGLEGCEAGFSGHNCQESCQVGTFGKGCFQTCHCENNEKCDHKNGTCGPEGCEAGFSGPNCQESCQVGTFGKGCFQTCHCENNERCDHKSGACGPEGCEAGFSGHNCQESCQVGTFGKGCFQTCHCENNEKCDHKNGTCGPEGCEAGFSGPNCQESKINFFIPLIICLSVLLIIVTAIVIYLRIRKSKRRKEVNTSLNMPKVSLEENMEMDSVVDDNNENDMESMHNQEDIYMNCENLREDTMEITWDNILSYVENKKSEELPFADEFLKLPKGLLYAHNTAKEEKNISKNRYKTILPYDHSRVWLHPDEQSSSDYINANYLTENKTYIATQGPLSSTINDFWRMVHQAKCRIIVMLTNLAENGKLKSEQYWPDLEMTNTYGVISVTNTRENIYSFYTFRQFVITKNSETFWVEHYQFTSWPDHGAPKEPEYFITFRNKVRSTPLYKSPILVHCSAGVGRSGTYIVLDIILEKMKNNTEIDVMGCILELRKDRTLIVQNRSQLEYIYDVLVEYVTTGSTMIYVHDLPKVYNKLQKFPGKSSSSLMKLQFEKLILSFNPNTNNYSNDRGTSMCYDNEQYVADDEKDAIDAIELSGYNLQEEFILISSPSEENFADFLRLIFLKRCSVVVMFDKMEEAVYWPQKKDSVAKYKHFVVKLIDERDHYDYIERTMKVSSSKLNMQELLVHQFQIRIWLGTDFPPPKDIVDIILAVQNSRISQNQMPIALHCLDGISKNGLFCILYMIIEILQKDSIISIVQLIRVLQRKKRDILTDYMSYHYCWQVGKIFLEELSLYGNITVNNEGIQTSIP